MTRLDCVCCSGSCDTLEFSAAYTRIEVGEPDVDIVSSSGSRLVGSFDGIDFVPVAGLGEAEPSVGCEIGT